MRQVLLLLTFNVGAASGLVVTDPTGHTSGSMPADAVEKLIEDAIAGVVAGEQPTSVRYDFPNPASQWTIQHAVPGIPSVATYSTTGERLFTDEEVTETSVTVTWATPTAGFVILS